MEAGVREKTKKIIEENLYLTIAVSDLGGKPWIANLYYAPDRDYNFYWYSSKKTVHSRLIEKNPEVALSIFDSRAVDDEIDGVYIKARAFEVKSKAELIKGLTCYAKKMFTKRTDITRFVKQYKDFRGTSVLRLYKAVPTKFYKLAPSEIYNEKYIDSRLEVKLK